jgi:quercetin dioxygenase-like cupin family protein
MKQPYYESILSENTVIRGFSKSVNQSNLVWHRDGEDRTLIVIEGQGWKFQRDNCLPETITEGTSIKISAGEYHRLIKGDSDLIITIIKEKADGSRSVKMGADKNFNVTKMDFLPDEVLKKIAKDKDVDEASEPKPNEYQKKKYKARGKRGKTMAKASELYKKNPNDPRIYQMRADSEAAERNKKGYKTRKRSDSMEEKLTRNQLRQLIMETLKEEMLTSTTDETAAEMEEGKGLSAKTKETLKKKANKRGLTPSSVYAEYKKGLAAWASSGSRKGMSQHQWAHARVNSATPSKPWAVVKKAKKKKK